MEPLNVVVMQARVKSGPEVWVGTSVWLEPARADQWNDFARGVADSLQPEIVNVLQPGVAFRFKVEAFRSTLVGPQAQSIRQRLNRVGGGLEPAWHWTLEKGTVYTHKTEGSTNGQK